MNTPTSSISLNSSHESSRIHAIIGNFCDKIVFSNGKFENRELSVEKMREFRETIERLYPQLPEVLRQAIDSLDAWKHPEKYLPGTSFATDSLWDTFGISRQDMLYREYAIRDYELARECCFLGCDSQGHSILDLVQIELLRLLTDENLRKAIVLTGGSKGVRQPEDLIAYPWENIDWDHIPPKANPFFNNPLLELYRAIKGIAPDRNLLSSLLIFETILWGNGVSKNPHPKLQFLTPVIASIRADPLAYMDNCSYTSIDGSVFMNDGIYTGSFLNYLLRETESTIPEMGGIKRDPSDPLVDQLMRATRHLLFVPEGVVVDAEFEERDTGEYLFQKDCLQTQDSILGKSIMDRLRDSTHLLANDFRAALNMRMCYTEAKLHMLGQDIPEKHKSGKVYCQQDSEGVAKAIKYSPLYTEIYFPRHHGIFYPDSDAKNQEEKVQSSVASVLGISPSNQNPESVLNMNALRLHSIIRGIHEGQSGAGSSSGFSVKG